jgi:hypothetical protein
MSEFKPQPSPWVPREIRITAPAEVLNNLELFQKAQASVLGRLGCLTCHSGYNLIWEGYTQYTVDTDGRAEPVRSDGAVVVS